MEAQNKAVFSDLERKIAQKVDRIEFSQIVQQKANQADIQKILFEMMSANNLSGSQKLQNYFDNTIQHDSIDTFKRKEQCEHSMNDSPQSKQCEMCMIEHKAMPQMHLRQAFCSLSDTLMNKENNTQQFQ